MIAIVIIAIVIIAIVIVAIVVAIVILRPKDSRLARKLNALYEESIRLARD